MPSLAPAGKGGDRRLDHIADLHPVGSESPVGVIGAGAFGTVVANLAAVNGPVLLYTRDASIALQANQERAVRGDAIEPAITVTSDAAEFCRACSLIIPVVPSTAFRRTMRTFAPHLNPRHLLIHGTKGFDIPVPREGSWKGIRLTRQEVHTMSEVVRQETSVLRIGCLSGPNLSREIKDHQPTAAVVASRYDEVIRAGQKALSGDRFQVYGSHELMGAEVAGALKNGIAIGSGILGGKGYGKNIQAILITRGLVEMVNLGKAMGASSRAFLGSAGIGDLIATATSKDSRNYSLGHDIGSGRTLPEITEGSEVLTEGVRTLQIVNHLTRFYKLHMPIFSTLHAVVLEGLDVDRAIHYLITYPYNVDVDFV